MTHGHGRAWRASRLDALKRMSGPVCLGARRLGVVGCGKRRRGTRPDPRWRYACGRCARRAAGVARQWAVEAARILTEPSAGALL